MAEHPGTVLVERYLKPWKLSPTALATAIGVPPTRMTDIVRGKRGISADTALRLARFFGREPGWWLALQSEWDLSRAEEERGEEIGSLATLQVILRRRGYNLLEYLAASAAEEWMVVEGTSERGKMGRSFVDAWGRVGEHLLDRGIFRSFTLRLAEARDVIRPLPFHLRIGLGPKDLTLRIAVFERIETGEEPPARPWRFGVEILSESFRYWREPGIGRDDPAQWKEISDWMTNL